MFIRTWFRTISFMVITSLLLAGCAPPSELPQGPDAVWHLVVIGDSSLWGLGKAFAAQIEKDVGVTVVLQDFALPALSAGTVLQVLQTGETSNLRLQALPAALKEAEVVVMFVNPLDSVDPEKPLDLDGCFVSSAPSSCEPASFEKWTTDLKAIWAEILKLREGQPTILRATDLYNPLVSPWNEHGVFEACTECWENMSDAARLAAEAYDIPFLSRLDAFNGVNHDEDPRAKGYIRSDGEHPSDLGCQYTAELLSQMGYELGARAANSQEGEGTGPQATAIVSQVAPEPVIFPLSEPGPYHVGKRSFAFEDASRGNRQVGITVWYPAVQPVGSIGNPLRVGIDLAPDLSGAPYPLILSSTKMARQLAPYLISHGFAWASVDRIDYYSWMCEEMFEQPLDILFALDQVAASPLEGLEGMIDAEHAGVIGYSFDGYNALALSGARIDPEYYLAQCPTPDATTEAVLSGLSAFDCAPAGAWGAFAAHAGEAITASEDGLWQPMTDARIRAVMPLAGEGWWLFGERGLSAVDRPTLILVATQDQLYLENALIFEHLGTPDKAMISFVGQDHMMVYDGKAVARMAHFAVAFFGYHLQGRQDLAWYFSEDFVAQHVDLAWGVCQIGVVGPLKVTE